LFSNLITVCLKFGVGVSTSIAVMGGGLTATPLGVIMKYSKEQLKYGFWYSFENSQFGNTIKETKDLDNRKNLMIAPTQLLLRNKSEERRILKEWIDIIPTLSIDFLSVQSHVPQRLIDAIGKNETLKGVSIKWTRAKSIKPITQISNLEYLHVGSGASILDVVEISRLKKLKVLKLENTKRTTNYSFLKNLTDLEFLELGGAMYSVLKIDTLDDFIGHLTKLIRFAAAAAVKCPKPDYREIIKLKNLVTLSLNEDFDDDEYKIIKSELPKLKYDQKFYNKVMERNLRTLLRLTSGSS
jgi:hypothetical protein